MRAATRKRTTRHSLNSIARSLTRLMFDDLLRPCTKPPGQPYTYRLNFAEHDSILHNRRRLGEPDRTIYVSLYRSHEDDQPDDYFAVSATYEEDGKGPYAQINVNAYLSVPRLPPKVRHDLHSLLRQVLRHELEHASQDSHAFAQASLLPEETDDLRYWLAYLHDPAEISAITTSLYLTAQKRRTCLSAEIARFLDDITAKLKPHERPLAATPFEQARWKMLSYADQRFPRASQYDETHQDHNTSPLSLSWDCAHPRPENFRTALETRRGPYLTRKGRV